jgi:hypothetical protein
VDGLAHLVDRGAHDLAEELLLAGEVLVDRLLGDAGAGRDLVHARAAVAVAEEHRGGGLHDRPPLAGRAAFVLDLGGVLVHAARRCRLQEENWTVQYDTRVLYGLVLMRRSPCSNRRR